MAGSKHRKRSKRDLFFLKNGLLVVVVSCILSEIFLSNNWLAHFELPIFDTFQRVTGVRSRYTPQVVIAAIDAKTLTAIKDDPLVFWGPYFAKAISTIRESGAAAIGIDLVFSVSPESWLKKVELKGSDISRSYDATFREQLHSGSVVLTGHVNWTGEKEEEIILPVIDYVYSLPDALASVGLTNLFQDQDGVIRSFIIKLFEGNTPPDTTFAPLLSKKAGFELPGNGVHRISYVGPPGTIPRFSFIRLVDPDSQTLKEASTFFENKVVIIAVEQEGGNDTHLTPYSGGLFSRRDMRLMSGPEIHANIIETIFSKSFAKDLPAAIRLLWLGIITILGTFLCQRNGPLWGGTWVFCLLLLSVTASYLMFLNGILSPVTNIVLALGFCYLGILGTRLTREEKERSQLVNTFSPYVSESVLSDMLNSEKLPTLGGEEKKITALFSDIRNFTTMSEKLTPSEIVEILNEYYGRVCVLITDRGGIVDKFIGDAVMALFGAPADYPDHAERCLTASLAMVQTASEFQSWMKKRFPDREIPEFKIGIGIHTGKALIGNIGSERRMEYTAIGDTINIASRLEGMCKQLGWTIVASKATIDSSEISVIPGRKETIKPRGRSGAIQVVEVLGLETRNLKRRDI